MEKEYLFCDLSLGCVVYTYVYLCLSVMFAGTVKTKNMIIEYWSHVQESIRLFNFEEEIIGQLKNFALRLLTSSNDSIVFPFTPIVKIYVFYVKLFILRRYIVSVSP